MKQGKLRTMSICISDIPKDKFLKHENGKVYLSLQTWDYDKPDKYDNDFSVSVGITKEEKQRKESGEDIKRLFVGNGKVWEYKESTKPASEEDFNDFPF